MSEWAGIAVLAIVCGSLVAIAWIGSRQPPPRRQERPRDLPLWSYGIQPTMKDPTRGPDKPQTEETPDVP